ncbi:MAG: hypothetical protein K1X29_05635 [Bdellovibrionales bacterium]|nr:hypothetical protein [Bdellovibrionales bacterium]
MKTLRQNILHNGSYKVVALIVSLVLWLTMQGHRDNVLSKDLEMQILLSPNLAITNPIPQSIKLEVTGPRLALKKISERTEPFTVDLGQARPGKQIVKLTKDSLNLPLGAKVISIQPQEFLAIIVPVSTKMKETDHDQN